jgi:CRP/FNR family transcriptional regulator, cyclic AMP receptor protein
LWSAALRRSFFAGLPPTSWEDLFTNAREHAAPAGEVLHRESAGANPHLFLVVSGLVRVFRTAQSGREVTLRHARTGSVVGLYSVVANRTPAAIQAVTDTRIVNIPVEPFRKRAQTDAGLAYAIAQDMTVSLFEIQERLVHNVFTPVSSRVAHYLLDVATLSDDGYVVTANHQEIADAVGSVREVVARVLAGMRSAGDIRSSNRMIILSNREALNRLAQVDEFGEPKSSRTENGDPADHYLLVNGRRSRRRH